MASSTSLNLQRSDWSISSSVTLHHQQPFNGKNQINNRSNSIYPADDNPSSSKDQFKTTHNKQCKLLQCWSSIPPLIRGLLLGILTGCLILAIILPLWLIKKSTPQRNTTVPMLRWNSAGITVAGIVGVPGNASNQLNTPADVKLDYANNLYITDRLNHRIQKYLFGSSTGLTVAGNGTNGSTPYELNGPSRVLLDANENVYVVDSFNNRIQLWRNGDVSGTTVAGTGFYGNASNQLRTPHDAVLDPTSATLYIADFNNHRIMSYATGVNNGTLLFGGLGAGMNNTQLNLPAGIYFDSFSSSLIIANYGANNIVRYVLGANSWTLVAGNIDGTFGTTSTSFNRPMTVTLDPMGNMYVADIYNHRIQLFYKGQSNGITIAGITGSIGNNATTLNGPWSVGLDSQLNLYVADTANHRIQKFLRY